MKFDPYVVFKRFRVCRVHFDRNCFNGDCKKLERNNAIPTLHLGMGNPAKLKTKFMIYEEKIKSLLKGNAINVDDSSLKLINITKEETSTDSVHNIECAVEEDEMHVLKVPDDDDSNDSHNNSNDEKYVMMEVVQQSSVEENESQYTLVESQSPLKSSEDPLEVATFEQKAFIRELLSNHI